MSSLIITDENVTRCTDLVIMHYQAIKWLQSINSIYMYFISRLVAHGKTPNTQWKANTHTHTFNGPFSGTTQVSRYQKG